jgi:hypothetical protein
MGDQKRQEVKDHSKKTLQPIKLLVVIGHFHCRLVDPDFSDN